ncbi:colanic acid/amylovoran biosynthesis glycosyltransferase [Arenibacter algicola]|uniref:Colanic acid/amylovoran biosynthesis glycosyltransferase n=1 Tax=Arenibacter algicola TaxID=616991 RepID=A0ABY3ACU6_9FLAO
MKVLHLERKFPGNTETFIVNQINALPNYNHSVFTVDFLNELPSIAKVYHPPSIPILSDKILRTKQITYFKNQLQNIKPDIVHAHFITDAVVFHNVTKNLNIPKICSCYGYDVSVIPVKYKYFYKLFYKPIIKEYDLFLAMTDEMKNDMISMGFPKSKVKVHYHGIDTQRFALNRNYKLIHGKMQILTIASLLEVKGHETVLRSLANIKYRSPHLKFHYDIIGDGLLMKTLNLMARDLGLTENVTFHGYLNQSGSMNTLIQNADVFVHPSVLTKQNDKEGIPGAIVEAMASGLPVISTFHGGIPFVICDRKTGFLIKERDDQGMADLLVSLYDDNLRKQVGERAKSYAHEFLDLYIGAKNLENIYKSLTLNKNYVRNSRSN